MHTKQQYPSTKQQIINMRKLFAIVAACLMSMGANAACGDNYDELYTNLPFEMNKVTRHNFLIMKSTSAISVLLATVLHSVPMPSAKPSKHSLLKAVVV